MVKIKESLNKTQQDILHTLSYFDLFNYPLKQEELVDFASCSHQVSEVSLALTNLLQQGCIYKKETFYGLHPNIEEMASKRVAANQLADKKMKTARRVSRLLASFPFVRCVMLSGSISKNVMFDDSDLDFMIITDPNRVWIAKLLMIIFRIFFLLNSHKYFCINFIIASNNLNIKNENRYYATELLTLIPTYGYPVYQDLLATNTWAARYYPVMPPRNQSNIINPISKGFKRTLEFLLDNKFGEALGNSFMRFSERRLKNKYAKELPQDDLDDALTSTPDVSKVHAAFRPHQFQARYEQKIQYLKEQFNLTINAVW